MYEAEIPFSILWRPAFQLMMLQFFNIQAKFEIDHLDYEKQLRMLISRKEHAGLIINDASQSLFLFVDKHHIQVQFT